MRSFCSSLWLIILLALCPVVWGQDTFTGNRGFAPTFKTLEEAATAPLANLSIQVPGNVELNGCVRFVEDEGDMCLCGHGSADSIFHDTDCDGVYEPGDGEFFLGAGGGGEGGATTEEDLEADLTNVSDVFTNNDGSLEDDDLTDNVISDLGNVASGVSGVNHQMIIGNGNGYQGVVISTCDPATEKQFYNQATRTYTCETDVTSDAQGLDGAHNTDPRIVSAIDEDNATRIGNGTDEWLFWCESGTCFQKTANASDTILTLSTGKVLTIHDEFSDTPMLTVTSSSLASTPNEKFRFESGHEPLVSAEVILRPAGDCVVAEESIVTGDPLDEWITCADTVGDSVAFSYRLTGKVAAGTTAKISMLATCSQASCGTFTLDCAAQSIRPGLDAYATHNTTGQQPVSFSTFGTADVPIEASATFTVNGTVATGAHIKGRCDVMAAPAQIADIRLHATAVIELSANSWSD